ncbi:MAG: TrmH family RNA methyltransferase [Saprospiraceae bacterium]
MIKVITSVTNPTIKRTKLLYDKSSERKSANEFVVEGMRETSRAFLAGYTLKYLIFNPYITNIDQITQHFGVEILDKLLLEVNDPIYRKLAYREDQEGIIGVFQNKSHDVSQLSIESSNPIFLVVEASEKPGNIGAILRTAEAAGVDAVLLADLKTDLYNPNILRSSVGAIFSLNIATGTAQEIINFLINNDINTYCAILNDTSVPYLDQNYLGRTAIVVGAEDEGLTHPWYDDRFKSIIIPMKGKVDSLNVSVSAGIILFEALRQRT